MKKVKSVFTTDTDIFDFKISKLINDGYDIMHVNSASGDGRCGIKYHFFAVLSKEI